MISLKEYVERAIIPNIKINPHKKYNITSEVKDNHAKIFNKINAFIIQYEGLKYFFDGPTIQIDVKAHKNYGWIEEPTIAGDYYKHPFVRGNNHICFSDGNEEENWKRSKVSFEKISPYQTLDFARMIQRAFEYTTGILTKGYFDNPQKNIFVNPVNRLTPENFPLERKRGEIFGK